MFDITQFVTLTLVAGLMILSPGPDFAIVVNLSLSRGRTAGIFAAIGIALANLCHVAINLLGLGVIIAQSVIAFTFIKILGAIYLIYLGIKGIRAKRSIIFDAKNPQDSETAQISQASQTSQASQASQNIKNTHHGFYNGFLTSILNPKVCLSFLGIFSVLLSAETAITTQIFYGVWISSMGLIWFTLVTLFFTTEFMRRKLMAFKHWLERITGSILVLLGINLLISEKILLEH